MGSMTYQTQGFYQALLAHDQRFDGLFFTGVKTTGIYCRPVCKVRTPKEANCRFFKTAASAEQAGFRPCLKCRPELAPGTAHLDNGRNTAVAAARLIDSGFLQEASLIDMAAKLQVTDRHLRRVFRQHWEVTPVMYAQTQRLLLAKQLLTDTTLPITTVAFAAGFESLSRFNASFKQRYHLSPRQLRANSEGSHPDTITLSISYRRPFDWASLLQFLAGRAIDGVEQVTTYSYRRTLTLTRQDKTYTGWIAVTNRSEQAQLAVTLPVELLPVVSCILTKVKHLFDTECQPDSIAATLGKLAQDDPGLRLPGAFDGFEMSVRAVLGQQITVKAARTIAGKLAARFGKPIATPYPELTIVFPAPNRLAGASLQEIIDCGVYSRRAHTIQQLAAACTSGLDLSPQANVPTSLASLRTIPGIGEWTAQYIAMRALAWPDAFPYADYALKKVLGQTSPARILALAEQWRPWRAYAAIHMWHSLN